MNQNIASKQTLSIETLNQIHSISQKISTIIACQNYTSIFEELASLFNFDRGILLVIDKEKKQFSPIASTGFTNETLERISREAKKQYPGWVFENCQSILIQNFSEEPEYRPLKRRIKAGSACMVPLMSNELCVGVLGLENSQQDTFAPVDIPIMQIIANQIQLDLQNRKLLENIDTIQSKYKTLFERIEIPLFITSIDGKVIDVNQSYLNLLEYKHKKDAMNLDITTHIFHLHDRQKLQQLMTKHQSINTFETLLKKNDDMLLNVIINGETVKDYKGQIVGYEGSILNQTELRMLEEQLIHSQKMQSIGTLTGEITHDFNNLIGGIMGYASLILSDMEEGHPYYNDVQTILEGSRKAAALTKELLSFFKKEKHQIRPILVNEIIEIVLDMISSTFDKSIAIQSNLAENIEAIEADIHRIQQIIMNLCINARDAMPEGGTLKIKTENYTDQSEPNASSILEPGDYVLISIQDTGIGMDEKTRQQIFQPFFTTKGKEGSGLGLAITDRIINLYGGTIEVKSELGKGSTFNIYLPASKIAKFEEQKKEETRSIPLGDETILLVDDDEIIRKMGKRTFETYGYKVMMAADGTEAVKLYKESCKEIDLVILDMIMPKLDGTKTFKLLKAINPEIKVLLASGTRQTDKNNSLIASGECGFIQKPFLASQLLSTIRRTLDGECVKFENKED